MANPVMTREEKASYDAAVQELKNKLDKVEGKGLSTEDFTTAFKTVLEHIHLTKDFDGDVVQDKQAAYDAAIQELKNKIAEVEGTSLTTEEKAAYDAAVQEVKNKVDKVEGKGLSTEDFTTAFKTALEHIHITKDFDADAVLEKQTSHDTAVQELQNKIDEVDGKSLTTEEKAAYDAAVQELKNKVDKVAGKGLSTEDFTTALKTVLEHIHATKPFDADVVQDNQAAEMLRTKGISWTPADPNGSQPYLKEDHIATSANIVYEGDQTINPDPAVSAADKRFITVANAFGIKASLKNYVDTVFLSKQATRITNITDIQRVGFYEGTDVVGAPVNGAVHIVATMDTAGNIGLILKDVTMRLYQGGIAAGGTVKWNNVDPNHFYGTTDPDDVDGHDGDLYFKHL